MRIDEIRADTEAPGLTDYEANLLRLIDEMSNGTQIEINDTGTSVRYVPGMILGGTQYVHDCSESRGVGYILDPLLCLCLYAKKPSRIVLRGATHTPFDPSPDAWKASTLPLLQSVGIDGVDIKVTKRGALPGGGGEVVFTCQHVHEIPHISLTDEGMVKRIRGLSYSMKVSAQHANRMVASTRGVLNQLLADVYVFTHASRGAESGSSPGYGLMLAAQTTTGCCYHSEVTNDSPGQQEDGSRSAQGPLEPDSVGELAAYQLLDEIARGGVVGTSQQSLILLLCALGPKLLNKVRLGVLSPHAVETLRHLKDFLGVEFDIRPERGSSTLFLACVGADIKNIARKSA